MRAEAETKFLRLKWRHAVDRWRGKAAQLVIAAKSGYDPNQPRVPAGNPDGGQWTGEGGGSGASGRRRVPDEGRIITDATPDFLQKPGARLAQARGPRARSSIQIGSRRVPATVRQSARYDTLGIHAQKLRSQVREIDPTWKPRPSAAPPETAKGAINERLGNIRDAKARLRELASQSPTQLIDTYRTLNNSRDLFGRETWPRNRDTVAVTFLRGQPFVGVNAKAPTYTFFQRLAANQFRAETIPTLPRDLQPASIGQMPFNAFYHAETTVLLRAAQANGGSLRGQRLTVTVDKRMCPHCEVMMPHIVRRLGNPDVTFNNVRGKPRTIRNGKWDPPLRRKK